MFAPIDNGSGFNYANLTGVKAGNTGFVVIGDETDPNYSLNPAPVEILLTPKNSSTQSTINTNATDVAVGSNNINTNEIVVIDFGKFNPATSPLISSHSTVNGFSFATSQVPSTQSDFVIRAYNAAEDRHFSDDLTVAITRIPIL